MNEDYFSNCKILSKNEFGLCYKDYIFIISVPDGNIITYFNIYIKGFENIKKYMKRMNITINSKKEKKKYYFIWTKNSNSIYIYNKNNIKLDLNNKFIIPNNNNNEMNERHNLIVINNKEDLISFEKKLELDKNINIFNLKQCSNNEFVIITKNNEMMIYDILCHSITMIINYAEIILENDLDYYFLKKIGKGMFLVNLINKKLGIIEFKSGKILKEFDVDDKICFHIDICEQNEDEEEKKDKLNKNILILNQNNIFLLDI